MNTLNSLKSENFKKGDAKSRGKENKNDERELAFKQCWANPHKPSLQRRLFTNSQSLVNKMDKICPTIISNHLCSCVAVITETWGMDRATDAGKRWWNMHTCEQWLVYSSAQNWETMLPRLWIFDGKMLTVFHTQGVYCWHNHGCIHTPQANVKAALEKLHSSS